MDQKASLSYSLKNEKTTLIIMDWTGYTLVKTQASWASSGCSVHSKICNQHLIVVKKGRESVEFQKQNIRCCFVSFDIAGE